MHPLFDETAALERVRIPGCLGWLVGWLVFLGTEAEADAEASLRVWLLQCRWSAAGSEQFGSLA